MKIVHPGVVTDSQAEFDELCEKIIRLITVENTAFRIVDRPEFHALLPANTRIPTRYHLCKNVMPKMVEDLREIIRQVSYIILILRTCIVIIYFKVIIIKFSASLESV